MRRLHCTHSWGGRQLHTWGLALLHGAVPGAAPELLAPPVEDRRFGSRGYMPGDAATAAPSRMLEDAMHFV